MTLVCEAWGFPVTMGVFRRIIGLCSNEGNLVGDSSVVQEPPAP